MLASLLVFSQGLSPKGDIFYSRIEMTDGAALRNFSELLCGSEKGPEEILKVLRAQRKWAWSIRKDFVRPYTSTGPRGQQTVWTFDLDTDMLLFDKTDQHWRIPLSVVRERPIEESDFEPYNPFPPRLEVEKLFPGPYHQAMTKALSERKVRFVTRMLHDFATVWCHILKYRYTLTTFRKLARAIVRIVSLDFSIRLAGEKMFEEPNLYQFEKFLDDLENRTPRWEPFKSDVVVVGGTRIILTKDLDDAASLVRQDLTNERDAADSCQIPGHPVAYLILSVRHVVPCRVVNDSLQFGKPEQLLDGINPPSDGAIELLLHAIQQPHDDENTALHRLPIEIQDRILDKIPLSPVARARFGCMVGLGSVFVWRSEGQNLQAYGEWLYNTSREELILFGTYESKLTYRFAPR